MLHLRPEYKEQVQPLLQSAMPVFDRKTEDGTRFRLYKLGSIEVRTTQEHDEEETVGAVYSTADVAKASGRKAHDNEKIIKVTEYVESPTGKVACAKTLLESCNFFVFLETERGNVIMTEKLEDGNATWEHNPLTLEVRRSAAKVLNCADCHLFSAQVADVKAHCLSNRHREGATLSTCTRKQYAHEVFNHLSAGSQYVDSDFWKQALSSQNQKWAIGKDSFKTTRHQKRPEELRRDVVAPEPQRLRLPVGMAQS